MRSFRESPVTLAWLLGWRLTVPVVTWKLCVLPIPPLPLTL